MRIHRNHTSDNCHPEPTLHSRGLRLRARRFSTWTALFWALLAILTSPSEIRADGNQPMQSLDEQVQEVKSDILSIAAELSNLEEKLLYPL